MKNVRLRSVFYSFFDNFKTSKTWKTFLTFKLFVINARNLILCKSADSWNHNNNFQVSLKHWNKFSFNVKYKLLIFLTNFVRHIHLFASVCMQTGPESIFLVQKLYLAIRCPNCSMIYLGNLILRKEILRYKMHTSHHLSNFSIKVTLDMGWMSLDVNFLRHAATDIIIFLIFCFLVLSKNQ